MARASCAGAVRLAALLCCAAVVLAGKGGDKGTSAASVPEMSLYRGEELDKGQLLKILAKAQGGDTCFSVEAANSGFVFQTTAEDGVLFGKCSDDRDCYTALECEGNGKDKLCLKAVDCEDFAGKKRCLRIRECQCFQGDFVLRPTNNGFRIVKETNSDLTDAELKAGMVGLLPAFRRNMCFDETSFNFEPCLPQDEGCQALEPCTSDDKGCFALHPRETEIETSTSTSTSTSFSSTTLPTTNPASTLPSL